MKLQLLALGIVLSLVSGCVTHMQPSVASNPAPTHAFREFESFEVKRLVGDVGVQEPDAMAKIQQNLDAKLQPLIASWNKGSGDTIIIEPRVREIKFVGGGTRWWAGALAGSSAVRMSLTITDKATGALIAEPEFYQRAAAMGGAYTFGGTDNNMLERVCIVAEEYLRRNYERAVGGPTGQDLAAR